MTMHKLHPKHFVLTVTTFEVVLYTICAIIFTVAPMKALEVVNQWAHGVNLVAIGTTFTIQDFFAGLLTSATATMVFSTIFVMIWNYFYDIFKEEIR